MATSGERSEFRLACAVWPHCARCAFQVQSEGPTWEFNPESGALGVARCPSGALSGALIRASSSTVWSRDLQASRGQWPLPAVHPIGAQNHHDVGTFCVRRSPGDSAAATGWSGERRSMGPLAVSLSCPYRIMSVCRSAAANVYRRLCAPAWSAQVTSAIADSRAERSAPTRIVRAWARAHARPSAVQVTHVSMPMNTRRL